MKKLIIVTAIIAITIGGAYGITTGPGEYTVGQIYYSISSNQTAATSWFEKAAIQGYAPVEPWVQQAAAAGYAPAEYAVGLASYKEGDAYYIGDDVERDADKSNDAYTLAIKTWIQRAANQGYQPARYLLAVAYLNGEGVAMDVDKCDAILEDQSKRNYAPAELLYGIRLAVTGDPKAAYWIHQAKAQGYMSEVPY